MKTTKDKKFKSKRFLPNLKHAIACLDGGDYATGAEYLETAIALCGDDDGKKLCKMALNDARQEREEALCLCKMALNVVCYNSAEWCDDAELRDAGLELLAALESLDREVTVLEMFGESGNTASRKNVEAAQIAVRSIIATAKGGK